MNALIEKIEQNGGYITRKDLTRAEYEKVLRGLKNGTIHKLKNGLYYLEDYLYDLIKDTDALIPDGVLCMWSAWYFYDMTDTVPDYTCIAVKPTNRPKLPEYPKIKLYYRNEKSYDMGITTEKNDLGKEIHIYDRERCVCDAVKYRNQITDEVFIEILKSYVEHYDNPNYDKLNRYAKELGVYNELNKILFYIR